MRTGMNRKNFMILLIGMNAVIAGMGIFFFFSGTDFSAGQSEGGRKIGASYMTMDLTYYEVLNSTISSVVEKRGDILLVRNPSMDAAKQSEQIAEMMEEGIEALFVTPVDWQEITPVLERAREKGIVVIAVDSVPSREDLVDCSVTSDNYDAGVQLANFLMGQTAGADIVVLVQPEVHSFMERVQGFTDAIADHEEYRIRKTYTYEGQMPSAMEAMEKACGEDDSFDAVFAVNDAGAIGAAAELERMNMTGIQVLGVDGSPEGKRMIQEKRMLATVAQYPTELGRQAAEAVYRILEGNECERQIEISVKLISRHTIKSYDMDKWQ